MRKPREATVGDAGFRRLFEATRRARKSRDRENQERDRARQRASSASPVRSSGSSSSCSGCDRPAALVRRFWARLRHRQPGYLRFLRSLDGGVAVLLYAFLLLDPIFLVGILSFDPETFAFLNPFLLVVIVRTGIRYGIRTMYFVVGYDAGGVPFALRKRLLAVERRARPLHT